MNQNQELGSLLLESTKEVERLVQENVNVKNIALQDLAAAQEKWNSEKSLEIEQIRADFAANEVWHVLAVSLSFAGESVLEQV